MLHLLRNMRSPIAIYSRVVLAPRPARLCARRYTSGAGATAYSIERTDEEYARLQAQHDAVQRYMGGKLTPVPAEVLRTPRRILELGAGTGSWAAQAAREYPDAEVIAVDMSPLPSSFIPPTNFKFLQLDITQGLPLEAATFDVIHARFFLMHLPNPEMHIARIHPLLAPGGYLIATDYDVRGDYALNTPILAAVAGRLESLAPVKGLLPHFAAKVDGILRTTQAFDEITVKTVTVPCNPSLVSEPTLRVLTEGFRQSLVAALPGWHDSKLVKPEERETFLREISQPGKDWYCEHDIVFTYSRKKQ
ncbi:unnamed protein product [Peniophora sp. CBMAI 1063]|nr:unnamed protein product [Peniophora sp. CBMAI 1063]